MFFIFKTQFGGLSDTDNVHSSKDLENRFKDKIKVIVKEIFTH